MEMYSDSLSRAALDLQSWVTAIVGRPTTFASAGIPATGAEVAICPWCIGTHHIERDIRTAGSTVVSAAGYFCVSIGAEAPANGCDWLDALYFEAMREPGLTPVDAPPAVGYWQKTPGLFLTLSRRIQRTHAAPLSGRVEVPVILDITTGLSPKREQGASDA